jgi:hypothetical protein
MAADISLLDRVVIASPCPASWAGMLGDEKVRFCELCRLNVYNLSAMTRAEAEELVLEREGRLCATFYQRRDGTILTRDCPVGLSALRRGLRRCLATVGVVLVLLVSAGALWMGKPRTAVRLRHLQPFSRVCDWLAPAPMPLGKICRPGAAIVLPPTYLQRPTGTQALNSRPTR